MTIDLIINYLQDTPITIIIPYFLGFLVLFVGSYTDIRTREVPDWLNFGLIGTGFGINLLFSVVFLKIDFILASIVGFAIFFVIAWIMFYAGQWGGGDSKILMGLGAMIGIDIFSKSFFLAYFLINALIIGALYGILWSVFSIIKNRRKFIVAFKKSLGNNKTIFMKKMVLGLFMLLVIVALFVSDYLIKLTIFYIAIVSVLTFYLWLIIKAVENACMLKYVEPRKLTEGDWIAKDVRVNGKYITGPKDLGIEKSQIKKLIDLYKKRKVRKILIKEGIPFVPSFLIAYIITIIYGNLVLFIF